MIKRFYAPAFVAASLFALTACTDGNDWDVDKSHDRLFGINSNNISVEAEDVTAILSFTGVPGAQYYIVEISTDFRICNAYVEVLVVELRTHRLLN